MGEIADMMLDGDLCEGCGVYLGAGDGYARRCAYCERAYQRAHALDTQAEERRAAAKQAPWGEGQSRNARRRRRRRKERKRAAREGGGKGEG